MYAFVKLSKLGFSVRSDGKSFHTQVFHCINPWAGVLFALWGTDVKKAKSTFLYLLAIFHHFIRFASCKKHFKVEDLTLPVIYNTCIIDCPLLAGELYSFSDF